MNSPATPRFFPSDRFIQAVWVVFTLLVMGFFFMEIRLIYTDLIQPEPNLLQNLAELGWSAKAHAAYLMGLRTLFFLTHFIVATVIIYQRPGEGMARFVAFYLIVLGAVFYPPATQNLNIPGYWQIPRAVLQFFTSMGLLIFVFIFPDGQFTPRWTKLFTLFIAPILLIELFIPESPLNPRNWGRMPVMLFSLATMLSLFYAPIYRFRHISSNILRQQTKWVVYGISIALFGYFVVAFPAAFNFQFLEPGTAYSIFSVTGMMLFFLLIPLSIGVAILRFRLWNIDPIINRTLVYGALSFLTIIFYVLTVGIFAYSIGNTQTNIVISFIATGIIAVLFEPLRQRLQLGVNRLMYGERDDPATVLTRLSQRLDSALVPDSVLQTIVETLAQTLKLPYAAISLLDEEPRFISNSNLPPSELFHLPLTYQTKLVGKLTLAPRAAGESFSPADMKLINLIAQQAGVAAYTVQLNNDLQRSRERLVTAQEEERRRLRRDLHDGVGPTLASLSQRIDTASEMVETDPAKSRQLLKYLKGQVKETIAEIRRLVYALRPPVLDEFGLVSAIREYTAQYSGPNGMQVTFDATEPLPSLPAAVEVAAYRIVLEAFTNLVRHAKATTCRIVIKIENHHLLLEVSDNGKGLLKDNRAGVGFTSMRERAEELGGECVIENDPVGGVTVRAGLPIGKELN